MDYYHALFDRFGPQGWWPGDGPFEVMVGAILTQNTNWKNVEKAMARLKDDGLLNPEGLLRTPVERLFTYLKPVGYFRVKTRRLLNFLRYYRDLYGHDFQRLKGVDTSRLRMELLAVRGIGPETADSILLYALERPVFVVDAYTRRVLLRHGLIGEDAGYHDIQRLLMEALPQDVSIYNEYHALFVRVGKVFCTPKLRCGGCPLQYFKAS
jgi:endonuclease-3 related protein